MSEFAETIALRALIEAVPQLAGRVGVGTAPASNDGQPLAPPYAVITISNEATQTDRFSSPIPARRPSWIIHAVSTTELGAVQVLDWIDDRLRPGGRGLVPAVPGRATSRISRLERPGNAEDADGQLSVWYAIAVYGFESNPTRTTL